MNQKLQQKLVEITKKATKNNDVAHNFDHAFKVLQNVIKISEIEGGDRDVLIPAALFHDAVIYPKNHPKTHEAHLESGFFAQRVLEKEKDYPQDKIDHVVKVISECSFRKNNEPETMEIKIVRDADRLEATGVISIMRTFACTENMGILFYDHEDPFCQNREPDAYKYGLDLFFERLLKIPERVYTETARQMALKRVCSVKIFLQELEKELK